jgi:hypothetical protein
MKISLSEYIGAKTTPTTYRLVGWRLLRVYAAAREAAIIRARKGRQSADHGCDDGISMPLIRRDAATVARSAGC